MFVWMYLNLKVMGFGFREASNREWFSYWELNSGNRVGQVSCMMTGTDLADDLEAGVHHLLDLGGEVAVAQLTNQRWVLRSRDQLSTNHSSPVPPWARRWCRCCRGPRTRSPAGERARSGGGSRYCEPIASVLLYSQPLWVWFWGPKNVPSSCTYLRLACVIEVIIIDI